MARALNFIDLFAGCGGLSEGFTNAGFQAIAHVEQDKHACSTLKTRAAYHYLKSHKKSLDKYFDYIFGGISASSFFLDIPKSVTNKVINSSIDIEENEFIFKQIDKMLGGGKTVDVLIGGPPCQAYSVIGRSRRKDRMANDPRNYLYQGYASFLKKYNPKIFVFENVLGLNSAANGKYKEDMFTYFEELGYRAVPKEQDSSEYGVAQRRKRLIIIGWRDSMLDDYPSIGKANLSITVEALLADLPNIEAGEGYMITKYKQSPTHPHVAEYYRKEGREFVNFHIARPHNERDLEIYKRAVKAWKNDNRRIKYNELPSHLKTHKNQKTFLDRFKVVNGDGVSHTITAHIAKDGHYYIHPDIKQNRSLSVREAARIQSFPDDFHFEGGRSAAFRQIGNAVPPLMATQIAKAVKNVLLTK